MKKLLAVILLFFGLGKVIAQDLMTNDVRLAFFEATFDLDKAVIFFNKIEKIANPSPTIMAYKGAIEAIMVKTKWNPLAKFEMLNKSRESFAEAIKHNGNDLEIRFLRFAVEHHIPAFLGYSQNLMMDKKFIMENLHYYHKDRHINQQMVDYILKFLAESGRCTDEEITMVKNRMNVHSNGI